MADPLDLLENLEALDIGAIAEGVLEANEDIMADMNATQLAQGLRADGSEVLPSYEDSTIAIKTGKPGLSGVTDHVTLFDEGDHYRELYAEVDKGGILFGSNDLKSGMLERKYGDIYGLNDDSKDDLKSEYTQPGFEKEIEEATGLKFN